MSAEPFVIDASNQILGRVASAAAKRALNGERVVVVNVEKAVISGRKLRTLEDVKIMLGTRTHQSQERAPRHPRKPDLYARRVVRGMLPWKKPSGKVAFRKVHVHMGVPEEYMSKEMHRIAGADASKLHCSYITLAELSREIGGMAT
ncbi:MAG: 50S ribosomal protein L13 [archaeon]